MQENDQNVRIRKATIQDAALLTQIEAACFPAAEAATRDRFDARLAAFADHFLICEVDGQAVGFVDGMVIDSPYIEDVMFEKVPLTLPRTLMKQKKNLQYFHQDILTCYVMVHQVLP